MPIPSSIADLSKVASENSPPGTETAKGTIDDYLRAGFAFTRQLSDLVSGPTVTLPSAATVNIGFAGSANIAITGTTTITAFDNTAEGALRWVTFGGALTLTHNAASLQLPAAANIITAAGDVALFKSLGSGSWKCLGYQRASGLGVVPALPLAGGTMAGAITMNNNVAMLVKTQDGTPRQLFNVATDNALNWTIPGGSTWNVYNQAGSSVVWQLTNAGATAQTGSATINANGTPTTAGGTAVTTSGAFGGGYKMIDGATQAATWMDSGSLVWGTGTGGALTSRMTLTTAGDLTSRSYTGTSDERLKKKWRQAPADLLARVAGLRKLGGFVWRSDGTPGIGGSAQELEAIWPEAVHTDARGFKSMNYGAAAFVIAVELTRAFFAYVAKTDKRLAKLEGK